MVFVGKDPTNASELGCGEAHEAGWGTFFGS